MEKRVFRLFGSRECYWIILAAVWLALGLSNVLAGSEHGFNHWVWTVLPALNVLYYSWYYVQRRSRVLEISDEGLAFSMWPSKSTFYAWSAVASIEFYKGAPSFWSPMRPHLVLIAKDSRARTARIPVYQPAYDAVAEVVRQHVPGSRFELR